MGAAYGGVRNLRRSLPLLFLLITCGAADDSLLHARRARALLGDGVWSRVLRIENHARSSVYPRQLHALVFEFSGRLWFYTDANGTQSLSLYADRLASDKADLGPLLREIEAGFGDWRTLAVPDAGPGPLPNGCFIESLAAARARMHSGVQLTDPQLLSYYIKSGRELRGHTVLVYRDQGELTIFDPAQPNRDFALRQASIQDAVALARRIEGPQVSTARFLPVPMTVGLETAGTLASG